MEKAQLSFLVFYSFKLEIEFRFLYMLGRHYTTESYPQTFVRFGLVLRQGLK